MAFALPLCLALLSAQDAGSQETRGTAEISDPVAVTFVLPSSGTAAVKIPVEAIIPSEELAVEVPEKHAASVTTPLPNHIMVNDVSVSISGADARVTSGETNEGVLTVVAVFN